VTLAPGTRLGAYVVESLLGKGGMGEVYRARDTRLKREVALKVLPAIWSHDTDRVARFEREAELLATVNHPNIASIYGLEQSEGTSAIVLELVDGETLAERIARGPLALSEALTIAKQIVDALEAAHDRGVIHRDLKPANVTITPDEKVKVLDFGLAKLADERGSSSLTMSPTLTAHATHAGVILGTAAYMSPEQARGKLVDRRTDIWAFGCVLFEMLTGTQPFGGGDTVSDAIAVVLLRDPDWNALPAGTPLYVRRLLRRCLQKDPLKRLPHIGVARLDLSEGAEDAPAIVGADVTNAPSTAGRWRQAMWAASGLAAGVLATVAGYWLFANLSPPPPRQPVVKFIIAAPELRPGGNDLDLAISPDGTHIVYAARATGPLSADGPLLIRAIDQLEPVPLRGITGRNPFFSPDGQRIAFFAGGELKTVSIAGGPAIPVCRVVGAGRGGTWGEDDTIVFATNDPASGLMSVPASGGEPRELTKLAPGEHDHFNPAFIPGRRIVLFVVHAGTGTSTPQLASLDLATSQRKALFPGGNAAYVESGHLVYSTAGTLGAVRFDVDRLERMSNPVSLVEGVMPAGPGAVQFAVSRNGTLVYSSDITGQARNRSLVWVDRRGPEEPAAPPPRPYTFARLSPNEELVALDIRDQENNIWIWSLRRPTVITPLTGDPSGNIVPLWTPDSRRVVFASAREGGDASNLYWRAADGAGSDQRLTTSTNSQLPLSFSPGAKTMLIREVRDSGRDLHILTMDLGGTPIGKGETKPLLNSRQFNEESGDISPDGRWMVYSSNESGEAQVFVRPFPNVQDGRTQISPSGGSRPMWAKSGRELFYIAADGAMMAVPVQTVPAFVAGTPVKLFDGPWSTAGQATRNYDVTADGQRFLMIRDSATAAAAIRTLTVVVNWLEELRARGGAD
jgi:serine/threonine-protein kinase